MDLGGDGEYLCHLLMWKTWGLTLERLVSLAEARGTLSHPPLTPRVQGPLEGKRVQGLPKVTMMMDGFQSYTNQTLTGDAGGGAPRRVAEG